jgi:hypothetical protein
MGCQSAFGTIIFKIFVPNRFLEENMVLSLSKMLLTHGNSADSVSPNLKRMFALTEGTYTKNKTKASPRYTPENIIIWPFVCVSGWKLNYVWDDEVEVLVREASFLCV